MAAIGALVVTLVPGLLPLRVVFALPLVLALPGYSLAAALFPDREIDGPRRLLLSVALSLSLAVLTGLLLNLTPFELRRSSWAVALVVATCAAGAVAVVRRRRTGGVEPTVRGPSWRAAGLPRLRLRDAAMFVVALCILAGAVAFARTPLSAKKVQGYTALWLLPSGGGTTAAVRIGLKSGELDPTSYRLLLRVGSHVLYERRLQLDPGAQFEQSVPFGAAASAPQAPIEVLLYRQGDPSSIYRIAKLWPSNRIVQ